MNRRNADSKSSAGITRKEALAQFDLTPSLLNKLIASGDVSVVSVDGAERFLPEELRRAVSPSGSPVASLFHQHTVLYGHAIKGMEAAQRHTHQLIQAVTEPLTQIRQILGESAKRDSKQLAALSKQNAELLTLCRSVVLGEREHELEREKQQAQDERRAKLTEVASEQLLPMLMQVMQKDAVVNQGESVLAFLRSLRPEQFSELFEGLSDEQRQLFEAAFGVPKETTQAPDEAPN